MFTVFRYCSRNDCGCDYMLSVRLIADDKESELDKWEFNDTKDPGADWTKVGNTIETSRIIPARPIGKSEHLDFTLRVRMKEFSFSNKPTSSGILAKNGNGRGLACLVKD